MNEHSNPLDYILRCAEQGLVPKLFTIQNAKDELNKLRKDNEKLQSYLNNPIAWGRINSKGDLYDLRTMNNPYVDQTTVLPLYSNREELKNLLEELKKP
jgi:hypothetical protein